MNEKTNEEKREDLKQIFNNEEEEQQGKKKKAFTLIELLAVIVILAIIAIIAVPAVMKILKDARKSAAVDTTYGIAEAAANYVSQTMLKNGGNFATEDLIFNCDTDDKKCILTQPSIDELNSNGVTAYDAEIDYKGARIKGGIVTIKKGGKEIIIDGLKVNEFTCYYNIDPHTEKDKASCDKVKSNEATTTTTTTSQVGSDENGSTETGSNESGSDNNGSSETGSNENGSDNNGSDNNGSSETGSDETASGE